MMISAATTMDSGARLLQAGEVDARHGPILYMEDVSVSFDGFRALNHLSLYIDDGELRCLIGPNGAGKTTLMDVITGKTRPDNGSVFFGQTINLLELDEPAIAQAGICRKFQKTQRVRRPDRVRKPGTGFENRQTHLADAVLSVKP